MSPEPKGLYLLPDPGRLVRKLEAEGWRVVEVGQPLADRAALLAALAEALALPDYLGGGYDALFDALTDRAALGGVPRLLLLLRAWQGFAAADPASFLRFVELTLDAGRFWRARDGDMRLCLED
jgi:hypothetical protein